MVKRDMFAVKMLKQFQFLLLLGTTFMVLFIIVYWDDMHGVLSTLALPTSIMSSELWTSKEIFVWKDPSRKANITTKYIQDPNNLTHIFMHSPLTNLKERQTHRRHIIKETCSAHSGVNFSGKLRMFDQIPNKNLDHLIVDDRHGIIYCFVPKVACTNWKRVMIVLSQNLKAPNGAPYTDPLDIPSSLSHNATVHLTFNKFWRLFGHLSRPLMHDKLQNYTKFLFVRDPFVRLISAFRNKFALPNEDFYKQFGSTMLQRYGNVSQPPDSAQEAFDAGIKVTFNHFIKYLLDPWTKKEKPFNEHWQQMYKLCHPCQIEYDFIGKLETLEDDTEHLLKVLGLENQIQFPPGYRIRTGANWVREWFESISVEDRRKLYSLYEADFRLFGYPIPDTLV